MLIMHAALAILAFAACGGRTQSSNPATAIDLNQGSGRTALDFQITVYQGADVLGGQEIKFSELVARGKPVVLNFWAGLCPPCRAELPDLERLHDQYEGRVVLFGLDVGPFVGLGSREDGKALLKELNITFPAGTTFDSRVVRDYEVLGMPTTVFIAPDGRIVKTWPGLLTWDKMVKLTDELLKASEKP